jgi:integrase
MSNRHFMDALKALGMRVRRQYNCRHTYATICLMDGMNPAFIAGQLGHSVQMLHSTYAKWIDSTANWHELDRLENKMIGTKVVSENSDLL